MRLPDIDRRDFELILVFYKVCQGWTFVASTIDRDTGEGFGLLQSDVKMINPRVDQGG